MYTGETWQIEETEASVTGYKNQLTGKNYRYDDVPGEVSPTFSIGQYDWKTKESVHRGAMLFRQHLKMWVGSVL